NGPQVREWAEAFAKRLERMEDVAGLTREKPTLAAHVRHTYALALGRSPTKLEAQEADTFLQTQTASYRAEGKPDASFLALTDFCQVMFGLNEFAYEH